MKYPKISVVTPSFNQGAFLEQTILSVLDQNYPNLEYIIIDGGSTDNSVEIIKKYENKLSYWVSEPDRGQYHAINKGFSKSTGEIMAWINSDDMFFPWTFNIVSEIFTFLNEVEWVTGLPAHWNEKDALTNVNWHKPYSQKLIQKGMYESRKIHFIQQEGTFWRRDLWVKSGEHIDDNLQLAGDFDLWYRFSKHSPLYLVDTILGGFRIQPEQKTASCLQEYYQEVDKIVKSKINLKLFKIIRYVCSLLPPLIIILSNKHEVKYIEYDHSAQKWLVKTKNIYL